MTPKLRAASLSVAALLMLACLVSASATQASPTAAERTSPATLSRARTIGNDFNARIGVSVPGAGLAVTEATSSDSVDSFTLLSEDLLDTRLVPARGGVWYTICPERALCPYPAPRSSRPASDHLPRRLALELVLRTFLETDAPVVGVSLPTPHYVALIVERDELAREVDLAALAEALREKPLLDPPIAARARALSKGQHPDPPASLQRTVDELTRPRTYLFLGLEPGPYGLNSWAGMPCWPVVNW
jgi:hypothetical protein